MNEGGGDFQFQPHGALKELGLPPSCLIINLNFKEMKKDLIFASKVQSSSTGWDEDKVTGLLKEALEKGDKLALSDKNLKGDTDHVVLLITPNGSDAPEMILLSRVVSKIVRKAHENSVPKKDIIKGLLGLRMMTTLIGDEERTVIVNDGTTPESFDFATLASGSTVTLESLIA